MHQFLSNNRDELVARCKLKVAQRPLRAATAKQLAHGVPMFLDQLTRTLVAENDDDAAASIAISGPSGGDSLALSEIGVSATAHGKELLNLGYTVDQVVHDYGDLCQAITDLAFERDAPFAVGEFRTLNRCLYNAIADAVTSSALSAMHCCWCRKRPARSSAWASWFMNCATRWARPPSRCGRSNSATCRLVAPPVRFSSAAFPRSAC